jgi:spermidine synthase
MAKSLLQSIKNDPKLFFYDVALISIMAVLAACGLIYQYLFSQYAGRVLGLMEHAIFTMIGVMIVSMGLGAFLAKIFKRPYTAFAWLEIIIACLGATGILIIGAVFAFSSALPTVISVTFGVPYDFSPSGGVMVWVDRFARTTPYILGFGIGLLIGMEIPFIARVREDMYGKRLEHNVGTIYGADYIGAGAGAAIFIVFMLSAPPERSAVYTAAANLVAGLLFFFLFRKKIQWGGLLLSLHVIFAIGLIGLGSVGQNWSQRMEDMLYQDHVIFSEDTPFQHITLTQRKSSKKGHDVYTLFLNGRTQFSTLDEHIYHEFLVHPPMLASARHDQVLVIGGGDGLAVRDVLKWNPVHVTLLELDRQMVDLFSLPDAKGSPAFNRPLIELNKGALSDSRVSIQFGDAFHSVNQLLDENRLFDVIIVDLPDPSHPDLNKLYTRQFYQKLFHLLAGDGAISIQSTSPYHAKSAFLTVGVTLKSAGFQFIDRYHHNIPSFGEWGWTIATKKGTSPKTRVQRQVQTLPKNSWLTPSLVLASFEFSRGFIDAESQLDVNRMGNQKMYLLHHQAWQSEAYDLR